MATTFTSDGTYDIPAQTYQLVIECYGQVGGNGNETAGGDAGYIRAAVLTEDISGSSLNVHIGYGGGGSENNAGDGGGASDVRDGSDLEDRIVVAGGGGGGVGWSNDGPLNDYGPGGDGGGDVGENGGGPAGYGGSQDSGGANGGGFGVAGDGGTNQGNNYTYHDSGGGGNGWYGGGAGAANNNAVGGGGGGSNHAIPEAVIEANEQGTHTGQPKVVITVVTQLDTPPNVSVDDTSETEADVSWGDVDNAGKYDVYRHDGQDPYSNGTVVETVDDDGSGSFSITDTGLTNGREYHYQVVAKPADGDADYSASGASAEASATTELPGPTIIDTVPFDGEVRIEYSAPDNNPDGHVEILRNDSAIAANLALGGTKFVDYQIADDTEHDYTARRVTPDATTTSDPAAETAAYRPIADAVFDTIETQSLDALWELESPWSGTTVVWLDREDHSYDDPRGVKLADLPGTQTNHTADELDPERDYTMTIEPHPYVLETPDDGAPADTAFPGFGDVAVQIKATTVSIGARQTTLPSAEWAAVVEHDGRTTRPRILDGPARTPAIRDLARVSIPVPRDDKWDDEQFRKAAMKVWEDRSRLPIEQLDSVEHREGSDDARTVLQGVGGTALRERITTEVKSKATHELAEQLVVDNTDLAVNVDDPPSVISTEQTYELADQTTWASALTDTDLSTLPVTVPPGGGLDTQQSLWVKEAEDNASDYAQFFQDTDFSGVQSGQEGLGSGLGFDTVGQYVEFDFTNDYTIPADHFNTRILLRGGWDVGAEISIDNTTVATIGENYNSPGILWFDPKDTAGNGGVTFPWSQDLQPGSHTLRIEVTSVSDTENQEPIDIDVVAWGDQRWIDTEYNGDYPSDTDIIEADDGNYYEGPPRYPEIDVELDRVPFVLSVAGVDIESEWGDTSAAQAIGARNEAGGDWTEAPNSGSLDATFPDLGALLDVRLSFSPTGSQIATPGSGFEGQSVDSVTVDTELDTTPITLDRSLDDTLLSILKRLAGESNSVFGVGWDDGLTFEWTRIGQREGDAVEATESFDIQTDYDYPEHVVVYGGSEEIRRESLSASHNDEQELANPRLEERTEYVRSAGDNTEYERGDDYEISWQDGIVTTLPGGAIPSGEALLVDYTYQPRASWTLDDAGVDPRFRRVDIPQLKSDRACGLAAYRIVQEAGEPLKEATVVPPDDVGAAVVQSIDAEVLPNTGVLEVRSIDGGPRGAELRLGNRQRVRDVVDGIKSRLNAVSRMV